MSDSSRIRELVFRWHETRPDGPPPSVEELCRDCPELADQLRHHLGKTTDPTPVRPHTPTLDPELPGVWLSSGSEPVAGYRLVGWLGRGGHGEVWRAVAPGGFPVALKFLRVGADAEHVESRAMELMKELRHANLLPIFGTWQSDGLLTIAMELADGTLADRHLELIRQGHKGIPFDELIDYMQDAARALDFLNDPVRTAAGRGRAGVQHRDVKPQNLLLVGGSVKLGDFGVACFLECSVGSHNGDLTPSYAAPEFFVRRTHKRSDQYSLAVAYCHLRGGELPFTGDAAEVMAGHLRRPPDLSMLPARERPVVARALAKNPDDRWPTCREFVRALQDCQRPAREAVRWLTVRSHRVALGLVLLVLLSGYQVARSTFGGRLPAVAAATGDVKAPRR
jgi:serine/threonine protein kinase